MGRPLHAEQQQHHLWALRRATDGNKRGPPPGRASLGCRRGGRSHGFCPSSLSVTQHAGYKNTFYAALLGRQGFNKGRAAVGTDRELLAFSIPRRFPSQNSNSRQEKGEEEEECQVLKAAGAPASPFISGRKSFLFISK